MDLWSILIFFNLHDYLQDLSSPSEVKAQFPGSSLICWVRFSIFFLSPFLSSFLVPLHVLLSPPPRRRLLRLDFRHNLSLTPSRSDLGIWDRTLILNNKSGTGTGTGSKSSSNGGKFELKCSIPPSWLPANNLFFMHTTYIRTFIRIYRYQPILWALEWQSQNILVVVVLTLENLGDHVQSKTKDLLLHAQEICRDTDLSRRINNNGDGIRTTPP